jgi:prepilin-type N-terminal cleavage/methylation domain-containing protein
MMKASTKGFTLIELIIVIGIIAVLGTVSVLALNPAQLFAQARDTTRITDFASIQSAVALYLSSATAPTMGTTPYCTVGTVSGFTSGAGVCTLRAVYAVDGTGWVGIDLTGSEGGSPLAALPRDPVAASATYYYAYVGDNTNKTFEINGRLESTKYRARMANDGGDDNNCATYDEATCFYEVGTDPGLNL